MSDQDLWTTTAAEDGDCAIIHGDRQLVGVGATVTQTLEIVKKHNAALAAEREEYTAHVAELSIRLNELVMDLRAISGERQNVHKKLFETLKSWFDKHSAELVELKQQLVAERKKVEAHRFVAARNRELNELLEDERESRRELERQNNLFGEQLAAERNKCERALCEGAAHMSAACNKIKQRLNTELASEREHSNTIAKLADDQVVSFNATCDQLHEQLATAVEALKWYAEATYPDDGSGRPPEAFQQRAKTTLAKVKEPPYV